MPTTRPWSLRSSLIAQMLKARSKSRDDGAGRCCTASQSWHFIFRPEDAVTLQRSLPLGLPICTFFIDCSIVGLSGMFNCGTDGSVANGNLVICFCITHIENPYLPVCQQSIKSIQLDAEHSRYFSLTYNMILVKT